MRGMLCDVEFAYQMRLVVVSKKNTENLSRVVFRPCKKRTAE
jgi:hypothetical protein